VRTEKTTEGPIDVSAVKSLSNVPCWGIIFNTKRPICGVSMGKKHKRWH